MCIPTQEELKTRTEDRKKEGIELPENAVSDMKSMDCKCICWHHFRLNMIFFLSVER